MVGGSLIIKRRKPGFRIYFKNGTLFTDYSFTTRGKAILFTQAIKKGNMSKARRLAGVM